MKTAQKCLFLVMKMTLQVPDLLTHDTNLLGIAADVLGEALDFLGIANKMASLLCDDALSVVLRGEMSQRAATTRATARSSP
jgi:hypothetical protein